MIAAPPPCVTGMVACSGAHHCAGLFEAAGHTVRLTVNARSDPISRWAAALKERAGVQKTVVALANKYARILWAVLTKD